MDKPASITDPLGHVTDFTYYSSGNGKSLMARALRPDPDGAGPLPRPATKTTYNVRGLVTQVDKGKSTGTDGTVAGTNFTALQTVTSVYDPGGNLIRQTTPAGVTQASYDAMDRTLCVAVWRRHWGGPTASPGCRPWATTRRCSPPYRRRSGVRTRR